MNPSIENKQTSIENEQIREFAREQLTANWFGHDHDEARKNRDNFLQWAFEKKENFESLDELATFWLEQIYPNT